jgi:hypothetical protein
MARKYKTLRDWPHTPPSSDRVRELNAYLFSTETWSDSKVDAMFRLSVKNEITLCGNRTARIEERMRDCETQLGSQAVLKTSSSGVRWRMVAQRPTWAEERSDLLADAGEQLWRDEATGRVWMDFIDASRLVSISTGCYEQKLFDSETSPYGETRFDVPTKAELQTAIEHGFLEVLRVRPMFEVQGLWTRTRAGVLTQNVYAYRLDSKRFVSYPPDNVDGALKYCVSQK